MVNHRKDFSHLRLVRVGLCDELPYTTEGM